MNQKNRIASQRRSGFTLIELLVVIAIIGILASLATWGVMAFLKKGPVVKTRNDLLQLEGALQKFKTDYGRYPPSQIRLRANLAEYKTNRADALDDASISFLAVMFKSLPPNASIPWAGASPIASGVNGGIILEGDQCLVFFLGGPPNGGGVPGLMGGFTSDATNPVSGGGNRKFYMTFETSRLINRGGNPFPSFVDGFDLQKPYVYFSSNGFLSVGGQGRFATTYETQFFTGPNTWAANNTLGVRPFLEQAAPTVKYHRPDSYQLLSAGADGTYGPGGLWTRANATAYVAGKDDLTNISSELMGVP